MAGPPTLCSAIYLPRSSNLSKALVITARRWAAVVAPEEADRLTPIVESLSQRWVGAGVGWGGGWQGAPVSCEWCDTRQPHALHAWLPHGTACPHCTAAGTWAQTTQILRSAAWWAQLAVRQRWGWAVHAWVLGGRGRLGSVLSFLPPCPLNLC